MEVTLVNEAPVEFRNGNLVDKFSIRQPVLTDISSKFFQVAGRHTQEKLQTKINSMLNIDKSVNITSAYDTALSCSMRIVKNNEGTDNVLDILWGSTGNHSVFSTISPQVKAGAGIKMRMELNDENNYKIISPVYPLENMFVQETFSGIIMRLNQVPIGIVNQWKQPLGTVSGKFTLSLIFDEEFFNTYILDNTPINHCQSILAKMLESEDNGDTVINSASGQFIKCHRAVLEASCSYFESVFKSGMQESSTNTINITDMEENEVRAFLGYLYTGDVKPALENVQIAWKLLKAGNYYGHDQLFSSMREILMAKRNEKFTVDLALDMILFARRMCDSGSGENSQEITNNVWIDVILKSVHVLKWYTEEKPLDLQRSEKYRKLHVDTPQIAMQLHSSFINISDPGAIEQKGPNWIKNFTVE